MRTNRPLPIGARVKVAFSRGRQRNPLTLDAEVVRTGAADEGRSNGIALVFVDVSDIDESLLAEIITRARS